MIVYHKFNTQIADRYDANFAVLFHRLATIAITNPNRKKQTHKVQFLLNAYSYFVRSGKDVFGYLHIMVNEGLIECKPDENTVQVEITMTKRMYDMIDLFYGDFKE